MIGSQAALEIILQARDEASKVLKGAEGALDALGATGGAVASGGLSLLIGAVTAVAAGAAAAAVALWDFSQDTDAAMNLFSAQTGIAGDELAEFREIAKDVWAAGLGDSIGEVTEQMSLVHRALGQTGEDLEASTKQAIILADVFGYDVAESTAIASAIMKNFGIDSGVAFDVITKGSQMGLDRMGDLGDTLQEYSSDFERLGFTAEEMLSVLNAGLEEGAYNTDVIADGIREFGIRFTGAEDAAVAALEAIGINTEELYAQFEAGKITVADAMEIITGELALVDEATLQAQAGAALFGTKWEDVGADVFLAAGQAGEGIEGLVGATDAAGAAIREGIGPALEELKRVAIESLSPLGDYLGDIVEKSIPYIEGLAVWLGENVPKAIDWLAEKWHKVWPQVDQTLKDAKKWTEDFWRGIQPAYNWLKEQCEGFTKTILPYLRDAWDNLSQGWQEVKDLYYRELKPALEELWESLGFGSIETEGWGEAIGELAGLIIGSNIKGLIEGLKTVISFLADAAGAAKGAINAMKTAIGKLADFIDWILGKLAALRDAIGSIAWPWSDGGEPQSAQFMSPMSATGLPMSAVTATGGGAMFSITNYFGPASVRSDFDIEEIMRRQRELLQIRGVRRVFEV